MENSNKGQKSALERLRESIEKRKQGTIIEGEFNEETLKITHSLLEVPEVKEPSEGAEFDLERYRQLTRKVDALYNNMLVSKKEFIQLSDNFGQLLRELANALDETLHEGIKPRF